MNRVARLQSAKSTQWVQKYSGKNIVRGYCNWYGVDQLSAVIELRQLGVSISAEREEEIRRSMASRAASAIARRESPENQGWDPDSDDTFAFIAGYTPAGLPYGVTWEEMGEAPPWVEDEESEQGTERDGSKRAAG